MNAETHHFDRKSLRVILGKSADWSAIAKDCIGFANASGGRLLIGIEDGHERPPADQRVPLELLDTLRRRIGELSVNVQVAPEIVTADNGGQFIELKVARSVGVASTSDGRYFLRVGDSCQPVVGDGVFALLNDRPAVPWETMTTAGVPVSQADAAPMKALLGALRASDRVKDSVREKSDAELLAHYGLSDGPLLTNLGVLLIGTARDRARLGTAPVVQVIKRDAAGQKINKWQWDDYTLSPIELIDAVWQAVPDFHESYELPDGLYRESIPAYDKRVVRELLVNALVHRPYSQGGDIFLNLHPDRLEIVNPGRLPLGVTPKTILHARQRRNERLATVFHDVKLMEKEGSGFDLMYDVQLSLGRAVPVLSEGADSVSVSLTRRIQHPEVLRLMAEADARFQLRQRERITLGMLAAGDGLTARELASRLELPTADDLHSGGWLGRLLDFDLVQGTGKTQARRYFVNPALLRGGGLDRRTTLKRVEPHRLKALIVEDLLRYPGSSSGEINRRVGEEVAYRTLKRALDDLTQGGRVRFEGASKGRKYWASPA